jgi:hypothetical protein
MADEPQSGAGNAPELSSERAVDPSPAGGAVFRIGTVLKILLPAVIILGGGFLFFGVLDGVKWATDLTKPSIIPVTGKVLFNGEPLPQAEIATRPVKPGLRGANGTSDDQGQFTLFTDVDGEFEKGAYAGTHRVTVIRRHNVATFGPAPAMTPEVYTSFDTSPLEINVSQGAGIELRLEGKASEPPPAMPPIIQRPPGEQR